MIPTVSNVGILARVIRGEKSSNTIKTPRRKGLGYFGELKRPDKRISTELSMSVNIDGKETEIPSLIPNLTRFEIDYLLAGNKPTEDIIQKAVKYARQRMTEGKDVFAQKGEQYPIPETVQERLMQLIRTGIKINRKK